jgi:NIPSNAP
MFIDKSSSDVFPQIANDPENHVHLVGSWKTTVGPLDTFTHIWEYRGYTGYDMTVARQETQPYYQKYRQDIGKYLISRRSDLMQEFAFWNTVPPRALGGVFELRTYGLKPGKLLEWESHWRKGLEVRKNFMEPIGAWFTQIGTLNRVYHIWQFPGTILGCKE